MENFLTNDHDNKIGPKKISIIRKCFLPIMIFFLITIPLLGEIAGKSTGRFPEEFFGRDFLISTLNNFRYFVLKDRVFPLCITNSEGWFMLMDENSINDFQNTALFTPEDIKQIDTKLSLLCKFLTQNGIEFVFVVPPNKSTIYPEYIPSVITKMNNESRINQVSEIWQETDTCKMLDLRNVLMEAKSTSKVFYATDTHWNQNGILVAHQALLQLLSEKIPDQSSGKLDYYSPVNQEFRGDMLGKTFSLINAPEIETFYYPIKETYYWKQTYDGITDVNSWSSYNKSDASLPTAIVYHDSFLEPWIPFLAEIFRKGQYYSTHIIDPNIIIGEHPDIVILELTERGLPYLLTLPDENQYHLNWWAKK
jgi:hypothetical protein